MMVVAAGEVVKSSRSLDRLSSLSHIRLSDGLNEECEGEESRITQRFWTEQLKRWPFAEMRKTMGKEGLQKRDSRSSVLYTLSMRCYQTSKMRCQKGVGYIYREKVKVGSK